MFWHWLLHVLGVDNLSGRWYGFWSGFGSDLSELALLAGIGGLLRRYNCHVKGCWRIGRHPVAGGEFIACRRHHPNLDVQKGLRPHHLVRADREHRHIRGRPDG